MLDRNQHRMLMFKILKDIFEGDLGKYLAFKGGTASYFLYGLDRFSTDLDFDVVGRSEGEDFDKHIIDILQKYGKVKQGRKLLLSYGKSETNIKIDINRKIRKANIYKERDFFGTLIKVQDKSTIFANKLVALHERFTNRDIYDVFFFFQNMFPINESLLLERVGKNKQDFFRMVEERLKKIPKNYNILDGLGELLSEKQKFFVKNKLLQDLIGILAMKIQFG